MRMIIKTMAPTGAYCRSIAWKLTFRAALRYFSDSERRDDDRWDIPGVRYKCMIWEGAFWLHVRSSESPRHSNSSIFLVMILVTSWSSSLSLSRFELPAPAVRVSWYSLAVFAIKVSGNDLVKQLCFRGGSKRPTHQNRQMHRASEQNRL